MFIIPFWYGLFYEYTAFVTGIIFVILFYKITREKKHIIIKKSINFYLYTILIFSYLIVAIWAIDHEMAVEGFLKFLPGVFYFVLLMQLEKNEKQKIMNEIPTSGAIMSIMSFVLGQIPNLRDNFFSENGRLVGFFQYSNSFALFLLIGIIIIANKNKNEKKIVDNIFLIILIIGILLTGSRTTFAFAIIYGIYHMLKYKKNKKHVILGVGVITVSIIIAVLLFMITGHLSILSRLFEISLKESTLVGRLIYYIDGLKIIFEHPFGLRIYGV